MKSFLICLTKLLQIIHNFLTAKEAKDFNSFFNTQKFAKLRFIHFVDF